MYSSFFCFFSINLISQITQNEIQGSWVKYHSEKIGGSEINNKFTNKDTYLEIKIKKSEYCVSFGAFHQECLEFTLKNNILYAGIYIKYKVQKQTKDTLILSEVSSVNKKSIELDKIFFLRKEKLISQMKPEFIEKDILITNRINSPRYKGKLSFIISKKIKYYDNSKFKGYIEFNHLNNSINTIITDKEFFNKKIASKVVSEINDSYNNWDYNKTSNKERIYFVCQVIKEGMMQSFNLLANTNKYFEIGSSEDLRKAKKYLEKGIKHYENKNYAKAIQKFTKSFSLNKNLIDAIFNRSVIYFETNQIDKACEDWNYILQLSNKKYDVSNYIKEYCNK